MSVESSQGFEPQPEGAPEPAEAAVSSAVDSTVDSAEAVPDISTASEAQAGQVDDPTDRAARLEVELAKLKAQHDNLNGQYMRLAADFDNFRKRQARDTEDLRLQIACNTLSEILPVVDNFDRARQQLNPQHEEAQNLHRSYQGLYKQLVEVFKQLGVSPMRVEGEPFDPNLHEAVLREPSEQHPEDVVIAELQRGYHLNGRVLRHALVKVSMGPGPVGGNGGGSQPEAADQAGEQDG
ncbi:MAG: nucleotide exchange factor GrpE [Cyanobacteriota bacterium]|nr:nucleotide exchange factor GrpE [Cyanobacteriota bacterium]